MQKRKRRLEKKTPRWRQPRRKPLPETYKKINKKT
jgi:hypothetical protein